jgi:uncharacterized membrane protein
MRPKYPLTALAVLVLLLASSALSIAQDSVVKQLETAGSYETALRSSDVSAAPAASPVQDLQAKADQLTHEYKMRQESNKVYEIIILSLLALISLFLVLRFLTAKTPNAGPHIVNATGLICIIFGTILLVIMAQSDQQLTAAVGILGAVAGYLFRSMHRGDDGKESS